MRTRKQREKREREKVTESDRRVRKTKKSDIVRKAQRMTERKTKKIYSWRQRDR